METTTKEAQVQDFTTQDQAQREWDSESRFSAYSTVANPYEADYCEDCETEVTYNGPSDRIGTCNCDH